MQVDIFLIIYVLLIRVFQDLIIFVLLMLVDINLIIYVLVMQVVTALTMERV